MIVEDIDGNLSKINNHNIYITKKNKNLRKCNINKYNDKKSINIGYLHKILQFKMRGYIETEYCIVEIEKEHSNYNYYAEISVQHINKVKMDINKRKEKLNKINEISK